MKVVKRVSLLKSLQRINEPSMASAKIDRMTWNRSAPYRLSVQQELVKFGYKNYKHSIFLAAAAVLTFFSGALFQIFQRQLLDNERETIYRYRAKEREHSGFLLAARLLFFKLLHEVIAGNVFPFYQYFRLQGNQTKLEEKHVRYQQYRYFMKRRDNKYDFLEIGVLQKFPFPITQTAPQPSSQ